MRLIQQIKTQFNIWALLSFIFITIILLPTTLIAIQFFGEANENWYHIREYLLIDIISNTVILLVFTALTTTIIGTSLAWIVTVYKFPFRSFFKWGLILPLAIPPFIGAYTYHGIVNYTGFIQSTLRNSFGIQMDQKFFSIMSLEGTIFIFTMFLFPYVFVITKSFFENQSSSIIENARLLGSSSFGIFFRIVLPISRAAIIGSITIVMLEVINDYGVVKYYGIQTFITSIFQTWFAMGDKDSAFKLAGTLMVVVIMILLLEKIVRGRKQFSFSSTKIRPIQPTQLKGLKAWIAFSYCFFIFSFGFMIPFIQLISWMLMTYERILSKEFYILVGNSFFTAAIASMFIVVIGLIIANYSRIHRGLFPKFLSRVTVLGYSVPGAVIAIGVITIFLALDRYLSSLFTMFSIDTTFVLRTSLVMLISAYIIRFLAVGYNSIEAGFEKVGIRFTEASRTLGSSTIKTFFKVDIPMVKGAIFGGFILVFVDILKELPLTMLLQPFNFQTLATRAFRYANDEMISEAASASLLIILVSAVCIFFFHRILDRGEQR
ncbi:ABC transporter permease [Litchfieldia salsa]|uniref:Iron(III) transport system permease protein n=1 Tax=Litchfieldia salsa TaxID=930152 RepID=A0A1H0WAC6_9BACI|nr:iron ABC transporter permease [Litchfieldia salsa]SDP87637.1 iron(III) transport system permease protein [Litchfieldia salsa]